MTIISNSAPSQGQSSTQRHLAPSQVTRASDVIEPLHIVPGDKVYLTCRVSGREQERQGNLKSQLVYYSQVVMNAGGLVVGNYSWVGSGFPESVSEHLLHAKHEALSLNANYLLTGTTCRYIRNPHYHSKYNADAQARPQDLYELALMMDGVRLMTILHPDASPGEVKSFHCKLGQEMKGHYGGRSRKHAGGRHSKQSEVIKFIKELLSAGPMEAVKLEQLVVQVCQVSHNTYLRVKKQVGVVSHRVGFGGGGKWICSLPCD